MMQKIYFLIFCLFRTFGFFISLLPYSLIHMIGKVLGTGAFFLHRPFRKKALTNLAIAFGKSKSEKERKVIACQSFQNLMITCLEFFRFKRSHGKLSEIVTLVHDHEVANLLEKKRGVIFLSAHQSNWEVSFLALSSRFRGIAIGRPIKNPYLYRWILSIREMNGGKIVMPKSAIRSGIKALLNGDFLGIVGDQAYPDSPYSYPLFGTRAWTASTPALLAYKTGSPLIVAETWCEKRHYFVKALPPIYPDQNQPLKVEVTRMMDRAMGYLESSIAKRPGQWLWVHDRWKQDGINYVKRKYRYGFILVVLPPQPDLSIVILLRKIYPKSFLTFYVSQGTSLPMDDCKIVEYACHADLYRRDWRFQLMLDLYDLPLLRKHFLRLGVFKALCLKNMHSESIKSKLIKPECLTTVSF